MGVKVEIVELGLIGEAQRSAMRETHLKPPPPVRAMPGCLRLPGRKSAPRPMTSAVLLGGPDCARLQPRPEEDAAIADRRQGAEFWSVLMTLAVKPADDETIRSAWLTIDLYASEGQPRPIAFHLEPHRREENLSIEQSGAAEAGAKGVKLGGGLKRSWVEHQVEILATGRLRSDPNWEILPSRGRQIVGDQDFLLIVKVPNGAPSAFGILRYGAAIAKRRQRLRLSATRVDSLTGGPARFRLD
jgi:hypothetical protein